MTTEIIIAIAEAGIFGAILVGVISRMAKMELKVETMWQFQMRRAFSETIEKGIATMNSPIIVKPEYKARLEPIKQRLVDFHNGKGMKLDMWNEALEIEQLFGNELLTLICVPCNMSHGACLIVALAVAMQKDSFEIDDTKFKDCAECGVTDKACALETK